MGDRPKVGVGVLVLKGGKVLLGKRKNAHGAGSWCFPGGHLEFNEAVEDCARREVLEETGLKIKNLRLGNFTNDIFKKEGKHYITLFVISDYDSGELRLAEPEKFERWGWFELGKLPKPLFVSTQNFLKQKFSSVGGKSH
ncbi:NUDIX domain-containing protein [Candidatus Woesearchaeota archaeon]|nr:NUDIX domain-containing protein [Candidatus Woesearchaeota archaeon]